MKFHYLIDYENVKDDGLTGIFDLTENDTVSIFYTENAMRMGFSFVERFINGDCKAKIKFISGETGEQALDKQICFYLGWLVHSEDDCAYIIISGDRGYDNVIDLARKTVTNEVRRFPKIKTCKQYFDNGEKMAKSEQEAVKPEEAPVEVAAEEAEPEKPESADVKAEEIKIETTGAAEAAAPAQPEVTEEPAKPEAEPKKAEKSEKKPQKKQSKKADAKKPEADPKGEFCEAIEDALKKKGGYDSETVSKVAEICGSYFLKQNRKNKILNRLKNDYGNSEGKVIYDAIKSSIPKQPNEKANTEAAEKAEPEKAEKPGKKKAVKKADTVKTEKGKKETELNNAVTQTMNKVKVDDVLLTDEEKKAAVAIINSHKKDESNKILTNVRNALVKEFRQVKGNVIYKAVKEHIEAFRKEQ